MIREVHPKIQDYNPAVCEKSAGKLKVKYAIKENSSRSVPVQGPFGVGSSNYKDIRSPFSPPVFVTITSVV